MLDPQFLWTVGTALVTGGAAWGGVKVSLNGTKARVSNLERSAELAANDRTEMRERMVRVETKIDHIAVKLDKL